MRLRTIFLALLLVASYASAALCQPTCLDSRNIRDSRAVNGHTIVFRMIDGSRWRGALTRDCPGLDFNGFVMFPANSDRVCAGQQLIRVLQNHQICQIGTIEPMPPRAP